MKVLHLSGSKHHWSGNEQQLADLIHNLLPLKVESNIFCYEGAAIETYAQQNDIPTFPQERMSIYSSVLAKRLRDCIRRNNIDVVHAHTSNFLTVYMVADLLFGLHIPTVFSRKGFSEKSSFVSRLKYNYKGIDAVICVSDAVRKNFSQFMKAKNRAKLAVIYDGITVRRFDKAKDIRETYNVPQDRMLVGNIANHVKAKDLSTLVKSANYLINTLGYKNFHFLQIGDFTELTIKLKEMVREFMLDKHFTFTGKIPEASRFMPQFDLYLMTSKSEGLPLAIYEAFLTCTPVVTTSAGGVPEAVINEVTGLISDVGNAHQLAKNIARLSNNSLLREKLTQNAHALLLEKFTAQQCASHTYDLYKEITGEL